MFCPEHICRSVIQEYLKHSLKSLTYNVHFFANSTADLDDILCPQARITTWASTSAHCTSLWFTANSNKGNLEGANI